MHAADEDDDGVVHPARLVVGRHAQPVGDGAVVALDRLEQQTMSGMTTSGTQAPLVNFVPPTMSSTMNVATEPTALITMLRLYPRSRSFWWWRTMPACDSVNERNTPTAYSGIERVGLAAERDDQQRRPTAASTMTPLENTSRSPRLASWRGR